MEQSQATILREIILNTRKPLVFRKFCPNWKCFDCSLDEWCKQFDVGLRDGKLVEFEQLLMKFGDKPQWERYRNNIKLSLIDFLENHSTSSENWTAFNYGRADEVPPMCREGIDFGCFGFPNVEKDISFWLGSKGANTPCHYDTYGCNIVVQIYGRKKWLLFPPETKLTPTRIPYEESSVYCLENFFSPKTVNALKDFRENAFECILDKGDVLIVPRNWWHYVENAETSLTVNAWIPLKIDVEAQIEECIVKYIIERNILGVSLEEKRHILNPNQLEVITPSEDLLKILQFLVETKNVEENEEIQKYSYQYLTESNVMQLLLKLTYDVVVLKNLEPSVFDKLMLDNSLRYSDMTFINVDWDPLKESLLNAIVHPQTIKAIKDTFLKTYSSNI